MQEGTVLSVMLWMQGGTARGDGSFCHFKSNYHLKDRPLGSQCKRGRFFLSFQKQLSPEGQAARQPVGLPCAPVPSPRYSSGSMCDSGGTGLNKTSCFVALLRTSYPSPPLRSYIFADYIGLLHQGAYGKPTVYNLGKRSFHSMTERTVPSCITPPG